MVASYAVVCSFDSHSLTFGGTVLKESDDLDIMGVTFDSKMIFEKRLHSVSRANFSKALYFEEVLARILRYIASGKILCWVCPATFCSTVLQCGSRLPIHTLNYWTD